MGTDLYNDEKRYKSWKEEASKKDYQFENLTKENSKLLKDYIFDMEVGANVSIKNVKGSRSYCRLNTLKQRMIQLMAFFQDREIKNITKIKESEVQKFFSEMRSGEIKTTKGTKYKSVSDYAKVFKAFWHWHQKVNRKKGKIIEDITIDLDSKAEEKPKWVYLDDKQIELLLKKTRERYRPLISLLYDSGLRPSEAFSLLVQDIHVEKGVVYANIRDETSKTFGRKIKLLLCGNDLIEYIKRSELKTSDKLFDFSPSIVNRYLGELAGELFGDGISKAGAKYSDLTMYDFRHLSCCYWTQRYKNNSALMYRFGWKTEKYILYYSEFLGMRDLIQAEDLYVDITKTELEKEIEKVKKEKQESDKKMELVMNDVKRLKEDLSEREPFDPVLTKIFSDPKIVKRIVKMMQNNKEFMESVDNSIEKSGVGRKYATRIRN